MPVSDKPRHPFRPRAYAITFGDGEWEGLEAKVKGASVDTLLSLMSVADTAAEVTDGTAAEVTSGHREAVEVMVREFSQLIISWNVVDAGDQPVEPDEAGLRSQDFAMIMALFDRWMSRYQVAPPLQGASAGGGNPAELASIPTETLPPSQES